jgi:Cu2+-exporting ATPase
LRTDRQAPAGRSLLYVGLDGHIIGIVELASKLRDDAVATLDHLRRSGIRHLRIVSGDTPAATRALARELGIDEFDAGILPDQKADVIARLQREGRRVCYVGDGVNDSLALSVADVSVSMAGAALVAQDAADVLLLDGHLAGLASLHDISSQLFRRSRAGLVSLYGGSVVSAVAASLSLVNLGGVIVIVGSLMAGTYAHALLPFRQRALRKRADQ